MTGNSVLAEEVLSGDADFALIGTDKWYELSESVRQQLRFEAFSALACRFALAAPNGLELRDGDLVATSYPAAWQRFVMTTGYGYRLGRVPKGKAESAPARGWAAAIYDIVQTGRSLADNGLEIKRLGPRIALGGMWRANAQKQICIDESKR